MKILFATSRFPWPILKGDKLRAWFQLRELGKRHELHLVSLDDTGKAERYREKLEPFCASITIIPLPWLQRARNLAAGLFNELPFQCNYFRSTAAQRAITDIIDKEHIDVCYVQLIRMTPNTPFGLATTVYFIDFMDAFSAGMTRRAKLSQLWQRRLLKTEARRLRDYEERCSGLFEGASIICEADRQVFSEKARQKIAVVPNGLNREFLNWNGGQEKEFDLIFTGNMSYPPNVQAATYLVEQVLPRLEELNSSPSICLAGASPASEIRALAGKNVTVTGYVDDLRPWLARSRVFAAPLFSGSGLQNKLLEAMAMGLPVVATELTNAALGAEENKEILIGRDPLSFAQKIIGLLESADKRAALGVAGRGFVKERYDWGAFGQELEKLFEDLMYLKAGLD